MDQGVQTSIFRTFNTCSGWPLSLAIRPYTRLRLISEYQWTFTDIKHPKFTVKTDYRNSESGHQKGKPNKVYSEGRTHTQYYDCLEETWGTRKGTSLSACHLPGFSRIGWRTIAVWTELLEGARQSVMGGNPESHLVSRQILQMKWQKLLTMDGVPKGVHRRNKCSVHWRNE